MDNPGFKNISAETLKSYINQHEEKDYLLVERMKKKYTFKNMGSVMAF